MIKNKGKLSPGEYVLETALMSDDQSDRLASIRKALCLAASTASKSQPVAEAFIVSLISQNVSYKLSATRSGRYVATQLDVEVKNMADKMSSEDQSLLNTVFGIMNGDGCVS
jgi:hypothetical protein